MNELWSLLNFIEPATFASETEFINRFGNLTGRQPGGGAAQPAAALLPAAREVGRGEEHPAKGARDPVV